MSISENFVDVKMYMKSTGFKRGTAVVLKVGVIKRSGSFSMQVVIEFPLMKKASDGLKTVLWKSELVPAT